MIRLVPLGGTGDVYLVSALFNAFKREHNRPDVEIVVKEHYAPIVEMFDIPYVMDDALVQHAQDDQNFQRSYENTLLGENVTFYAHPCFTRTATRVDRMTAHPDASQADMYRMIMRLPLDAPLTQPKIPHVDTVPGTVLVLPEAVSWPNIQPLFWDRLIPALEEAGWVIVRNDRRVSLSELFMRAASCEWVIGPQCGVISILCTAQFSCRKTVLTPSVDNTLRPEFLPTQTYPYAYVTKFSNTDYDVEEFKITDDNHLPLIHTVVNSVNGLGLWPHNPKPTLRIKMSLTPGDFLDRLAVLTVKRTRFSEIRRAAIEREYCEHVEQRRLTAFPRGTDALFDKLVRVHEQSFDILNKLVPVALDQSVFDVEAHIVAIECNKQRVQLKQEIDALCHAPFTEVKDYYGEDETEDKKRFAEERRNRILAKVGSRTLPMPTHHTQTNLTHVKRPWENYAPREPKIVDCIDNHNLVAYQGRVYVIPQSLGPVDLTDPRQHTRPGMRYYSTLIDAQRALQKA